MDLLSAAYALYTNMIDLIRITNSEWGEGNACDVSYQPLIKLGLQEKVRSHR